MLSGIRSYPLAGNALTSTPPTVNKVEYVCLRQRRMGKFRQCCFDMSTQSSQVLAWIERFGDMFWDWPLVRIDVGIETTVSCSGLVLFV